MFAFLQAYEWKSIWYWFLSSIRRLVLLWSYGSEAHWVYTINHSLVIGVNSNNICGNQDWSTIRMESKFELNVVPYEGDWMNYKQGLQKHPICCMTFILLLFVSFCRPLRKQLQSWILWEKNPTKTALSSCSFLGTTSLSGFQMPRLNKHKPLFLSDLPLC